MPEHILITGGAGYIGSILTPALLGQGYKVTVLDAFTFHQASLLECASNQNLSVVRGDCRDQTVLSRLMKDADIIIVQASDFTGIVAQAATQPQTLVREIVEQFHYRAR